MGAKYDQLDLDERIEMCRLHEAGTSRREIGRIIGRSASTVGRELRRNRLPRGGYKPASADRIAFSRRRRLSRIERVIPLRSFVCDRLAMGWSPEQIAGRLEQEGSGRSMVTSRSIASSTARACAGRSCIASCRGPRRRADGAISSVAETRSRPHVHP